MTDKIAYQTSLVVSISLLTAHSSALTSRFVKHDLPTLGVPIIATRKIRASSSLFTACATRLAHNAKLDRIIDVLYNAQNYLFTSN